jgi:hypothetical protein
MGPLIGDLLPLAIGVALSPIPVIAVILMLFGRNARSTSLGFLLGWMLGLVVVGGVVGFLADPTQASTGGETSSLAAIARLLLGLFFLLLAYRNWRKRPKPGEQAEMPKWMDGIDSLTAGKALGPGALLSGVNPKNLALTLAAGVAIAEAGLNPTQAALALAFFVLVASVSVAAPVILNLTLGDRAATTLNSWKAWLMQNNATVMVVLSSVFGMLLLGKGLGALIGG